jgi:hypothetical protein
MICITRCRGRNTPKQQQNKQLKIANTNKEKANLAGQIKQLTAT